MGAVQAADWPQSFFARQEEAIAATGFLEGRKYLQFWDEVLPDHHLRITSNAKDLLSRIFTIDPVMRPSIHDYLYDP